jgi:hypothetical protein
MGTSNLNRGGRPSTEVVVPARGSHGSMCLDLTALRGALAQGPCWSRRGGTTSTRGPVIPCRTAAALHHGFSLLESCLEQSRWHGYRGAA